MEYLEILASAYSNGQGGLVFFHPCSVLCANFPPRPCKDAFFLKSMSEQQGINWHNSTSCSVFPTGKLRDSGTSFTFFMLQSFGEAIYGVVSTRKGHHTLARHSTHVSLPLRWTVTVYGTITGHRISTKDPTVRNLISGLGHDSKKGNLLADYIFKLRLSVTNVITSTDSHLLRFCAVMESTYP